MEKTNQTLKKRVFNMFISGIDNLEYGNYFLEAGRMKQ